MGLRTETDLKFTFEELKTDISFSDVNIDIVDKHYKLNVYQRPINCFK